ncbi:MAG: type IV pilin N-terminal domain-containing protein [Methanoregula sp.]|jgi:FlaG/FlaF family flagellin (archaellin)
MKSSNQDAVSPVIGVMLMLVVTIIIAAVVSAFAGGALGSQAKPPQATIKGVFSQYGGMQIIHTGGDAIPASNLMFTVANDATFGQGLSSTTTQIVDKSIITDGDGNYLQNTDGTSSVTVFAPGQTIYISRDNLNPYKLQPQIAPSNDNGGHGQNATFFWYDGKWGYEASPKKDDLWNLCFINPNSVGKSFTLTMSDKTSGATIARTTVVITA